MGGYNSYYVESDSDAGSDKFKEEIGGRKIDRSKTHMIFGVRCLETSHKVSLDSTEIVVGLLPLKDLEDDDSDGKICTDDLDGGEILSVVLDHLQSQLSSQENSFELVEIGADPVVSLAASKVLSGNDQSVVVRHPDEQRLRVLEHAHLYFNEGSKKIPSLLRTEQLEQDDSFDGSSNSSCMMLFTSAKLVSSRLEEVMVRFADCESCRVVVPSAIVSAQQLEKYEFRVVGASDSAETNGDSAKLLEILSAK